ncbi:MAG: TolC family protein [Fibrobacter sp.]|nr:TolC family protein [Fibrobacter sp.]
MINQKSIIFGLLVSTSALFAGGTWTLEDCLKQAKAKSLSMEIASLREQAADISIQQNKISRYPSVSANINNTLSDNPFNNGAKDHYSLSFGLSGSWTIWDGGVTSLNTESSELNKQAVQQSTKQTERNVQENILNAYMNLLAAQEKLITANASVELAQAEFENYTKLFEAGSITKKDLTQSQSNVMQKQVAKLSAELSVNSAKTTLRQLMELPANEEIEITDPNAELTSPDSLEAIPPYDQLLADIRKVNPGLKSDSIAIQVAQKNTKVASKNSSITVSLGANAGSGIRAWHTEGTANQTTVTPVIDTDVDQKNENRFVRQLKSNYQHSISLGINIPLVDRGATANKVLQAQINEAESQMSLRESSKNLENNVEKLYLNAMSADMQWKAAALQVEAETEAMAVAEEQRNAGALTYTDYLSQKNSLENAKVTLTNAKYTSLLARKLIDLYLGKMD